MYIYSLSFTSKPISHACTMIDNTLNEYLFYKQGIISTFGPLVLDIGTKLIIYNDKANIKSALNNRDDVDLNT